tara:strand:- start:677 stop:1009 length:333 start_codon:yes stop_codon:yes gene_type:complete
MRYTNRSVIRNRHETYEEVFEERDVRRINHFTTPRLRHLDPTQIRYLTRATHIWKVGDRYYKLAHKHYGNSKYWWAIAWYNKRPTESHVKIGETIYIPKPLEDLLRFLGV